MTNSESIFSEKEVESLRSQHLAGLAASSPEGIPDLTPISFDFDDNLFYISGLNVTKTTKYRNIMKNNNVALVMNDLKMTNPWDPRGIKIYEAAEIVAHEQLPQGQLRDNSHFRPTYIRIKPLRKWSLGLDEPVFRGDKFIVSRAASSSSPA